MASPVQAADWDATDKALFAGFVALQVVDTLQTNYIRQHPDQFQETNSLYGNPPNMVVVVGLKTMMTASIYYAVRDVEPSTRKWALGLADILYIGVVGHNASLGVRLAW